MVVRKEEDISFGEFPYDFIIISLKKSLFYSYSSVIFVSLCLLISGDYRSQW